MNTKDIQKRLLSHRIDLLARYQDALQRTDDLTEREIESIDLATGQWDARVISRLAINDATALERIAEALRRLRDGTYGTCAECGGAIEEERLFVLPETPVCFECASFAERAHAA